MINSRDISSAITILQYGGIIAYPTEAVFGIGCDPFNQIATERILQLKHRSVDKGLILIASSWEQVKDLVKPIEQNLLEKSFASWPGPSTWLFPASNLAPKWIIGTHTSIAIRITAHPIARALCEQFNHPIVSTSANIEGQLPAKTAVEVLQQFPNGIDFIVPGEVGNLAQPTTIRDILSDKILR